MKKNKYADEQIDFQVIKDFLPPPSQLVPKEDTVKITISLNKSSIQFFKDNAKRNHKKYQKMIREVVDRYAAIYQNA